MIDFAPSALSPETDGGTKDPIGPVFLISPYNYPLISIASSLVPAVLSGNPVIIKPSHYAPLSASRFSHAFAFAGVENLVQTSLLNVSNIPEFVTENELARVHLTGKGRLEKDLREEINQKNFVDVSLYLSANNGVYIAKDADMEKCVSNIIKNSLENGGQSNFRYTRIFVHKALFDDFLQKAVPLMLSYSIGDPMDDFTTLGPMTEPETIEILRSYIDEAVSVGGQVLCGGMSLNDETGKGRFFEPTILTGIDDSLNLMVLFM